MRSYEKLFEPVRIGNMKLHNRIVMPPMVTNFCEGDGSVNDRYVAYMRARAKGGVGLIITEATYVHPSGKGFPYGLGVYKDELIPGLKRLTETVHEEGKKIALQLFHCGRQSVEAVTGMTLIAPSPIPCPVCGDLPKEMTGEDIRQIVAAFGDAAARAKEAGFDAVEVHGAHGYLLCQFLSPYSNHRSDEYGGALANRARFPLEVVKKVRERVGWEFPMTYRMSAEEYVPGGLTLEDTKPYARMLVENGINAIHVTGGVYESAAMIIQPAAVSQGVFVENAAAIKEAIDGAVPVIVAGRLKDPDIMQEVVESEKVDIVSTGRALLADPEYPAKLLAGHPEDIRKCIGCEQGCADRLFAGLDIGCLGNPLTGREWQYDLTLKAAEKKRVLVVGGGPGGLEAARIAALRGHEVLLCEKNGKPGGLVNLTVNLPFKEEFDDLLAFQVRQVEKLGVRFELNRTVDEAFIDQVKPDAIIIATGSRPIIPAIPGIEHPQVCGAEEILAGAPFGKKIAVIGGGAVGCEVAELLADRGANVTVIEMLDDAAKDVGMLERALLMQRLKERNVTILTKTVVSEVTPEGDLVLEKDCGKETAKGFDTIVTCVGYQPVTVLSETLQEKGIPFVSIGDCVKARKVIDAVWEAFQQAYLL
ncbi:MAG TPA: FAD-dependent oxidoreductase [Geobacteraceae bacterium]|nr:FAD-dependent oxidoreductase [Geobacteraceae bacterium]